MTEEDKIKLAITQAAQFSGYVEENSVIWRPWAHKNGAPRTSNNELKGASGRTELSLLDVG